MRLVLRLFVAFCIATVLAQAIILGMSAAKGNLKAETFTKVAALVNGIDISGEKLQRVLDDYRRAPTPRYEDVLSERANQNLDLQMREESVARMQKDATEKLEEFKTMEAAFNERLAEFYKMLDLEKAAVLEKSLTDVKRTLESMAPDQAKDQMLKLYKSGQKSEVIAILKAMPADKSKKIVGEFVGEDESQQLNEMLMMMLRGEPTTGLLENAAEIAE